MLSKIVVSILPKMPQRLVWIFSKKYIAGKTLDDALSVSKKLNNEGFRVTVDLLGEFIEDLSEAHKTKETYLDIIDAFDKNNINGGVSVKPTFFGLLLNKEKCFEYISEVVERAYKKGIFVRIDMEDSQCTDMEIDIYERLHVAYPNTVGLVLQAYMRRTTSDIDRLSAIHSDENPVNIRLCKGIYIEDVSIAYKKYHEINENYMFLLDKMLLKGMKVGIATHDKNLVKSASELLKKKEIPESNYEFQMLYGVEAGLRKQIRRNGYNLRVYIPYGKDWFGYSVRRLKENPKIAMHIMKSIFSKG